jgi:hypothetical protein
MALQEQLPDNATCAIIRQKPLGPQVVSSKLALIERRYGNSCQVVFLPLGIIGIKRLIFFHHSPRHMK